MLEKDKALFMKLFFVFFIGLLIYLSFLMIKPFMSYILVALLVAYLFYPLHVRISRYLKTEIGGALVVTLLILAVIIVPLVLVANLLVTESFTLYEKVNIGQIESFISSLFNGKLDTYVAPFLQKGLDSLVTWASGFLLSLPIRLMGLLIAIGVLYFSFKDGHFFVENVRTLLPLKKEDKEKVFDRFKATMDAIVYGTIAIALIEGVIASFIYWIFGVPTPIIWGLFTAVISMLPFLGPMVVWLPLAIYLYLNGHVVAAFGLGIIALLLLNLVLDLFLKNKIIGSKGKIHPVLVLLGVIGGVSVFGVLGFIVGPFLLSLLTLLIGLLFNQNETRSQRH